MPPKIVTISKVQRSKLEELWFIFGNNGSKSTRANHRFIQCILEEGKDYRSFFKPSRECREAVDKILR